MENMSVALLLADSWKGFLNQGSVTLNPTFQAG